MIIQNVGNKNVLNTQMQNLGLGNIVNKINENVGQKKNYDILELSEKALELLKEKSEEKASEKEPVINYENSETVKSTRWGVHTKAEFAEMSFNSQRNDLKTFSDQIDYAKSKLEFTMEKITELENYLSGAAPHIDPNMTRETAEAYLHNYKQSIVQDFSDFTIGRSQYHADEFDKLSGGLASKAFENPLHSLNAESLGLSNLTSDPTEIMNALDSASKIINQLTENLESAFEIATGGKGFTEPAKSHSIFGADSSLDFFASQMEKGYKIISGNLELTGETFEI